MKSNIELVLEDVRNGKPVIITDSKNREDEADLFIAAEMANYFNLNFCLKYARGLLCVPCTKDRLDRLQLPMMQSNGLDPMETPFAVSVDGIENCTTGMSVSDRLKTISIILDENSKPSDLHYPGHIFPLRGKPNLLKDRTGHTEAAIELAQLAGFKSVGVIIEIMADDGTMLRNEGLESFSKTFNLRIISIQEIYDIVYSTK